MCVVVDGVEHPIHTDFRPWLRFDRLIRQFAKDSATSDEHRTLQFLMMYQTSLPTDIEKAIQALFSFYSLEEREEETEAAHNPNKEPVFDLEQDSAFIFGAFMQVYRVDLVEIEYMHWWKFRKLIDALPGSTKLSDIMDIRSRSTKDLKGEDKRRLNELKRIYSIKGEKRKPVTLEERNRLWIETFERRAKQAGLQRR